MNFDYPLQQAPVFLPFQRHMQESGKEAILTGVFKYFCHLNFRVRLFMIYPVPQQLQSEVR